MYYINGTASESGNHGNPVSNQGEGMVALPDELLSEYIACKGFATLMVDDDTVTSLAINQAAYDAYMAEHPDQPEPEEEPTTEELLNIMLGVSNDA